jgi:hypothetical protein
VYAVPFWKSHEIDSREGLDLCAWLMHQYGLDQRISMATPAAGVSEGRAL